MDALKRIVAMLSEESAQRRIAAAIVLAELKVDSRDALEALALMAHDPLDALALPAIEALAAAGNPKTLPALLDAVGRSGEVGAAARKAVAALGPAAVPVIKERIATASPALRGALSEVLAAVGGKASFDTLLKGLYDADREAVQRTALAVRHEIKGATQRDRSTMLSLVEKFLEAKKTLESEQATRVGLKILGYLEDPATLPLLLSFTRETYPPVVRIEALTALRYPMAQAREPGKVLGRIVDLLEDRDGLVRRTARETLATLPMPKSAAPELLRLAKGSDAEVARFAIARLGELGTGPACEALAEVLRLSERGRVQEAARAMAKLPEGAAALAAALAETREETLAQVLSETLLPRARELGKASVAKLVKEAVARLGDSVFLSRHLLEPVREAAPKEWAKTLREQATRLFKKEPERALPLYASLCRSSEASPDDRYAYARMLLGRSAKDAHPLNRQKDPALEELLRLAEDGFPLGKTLSRDKSLSEEDRFYVGFDLVERHSSEARAAGAALLEAITEKGPRTRLGKAAKNKLSLAGLSEKEPHG